MTENRITSLRQLSQDIPPSRDLWQNIEREIGSTDAGSSGAGRSARRAWMSGLALAATVAAIAVGIWIGRTQLPATSPVAAAPVSAVDSRPVYAAFVTDPRYLRDRAALLKSLQQRLDALPLESQKKVADSVATLQKAKQDLEDALGKDPGNALLQELLVNTYQDEMRVLTTVQQAGSTGGGI